MFERTRLTRILREDNRDWSSSLTTLSWDLWGEQLDGPNTELFDEPIPGPGADANEGECRPSLIKFEHRISARTYCLFDFERAALLIHSDRNNEYGDCWPDSYDEDDNYDVEKGEMTEFPASFAQTEETDGVLTRLLSVSVPSANVRSNEMEPSADSAANARILAVRSPVPRGYVESGQWLRGEYSK